MISFKHCLLTDVLCLIIFMVIINPTYCFPVTNQPSDGTLDKDEKRYPNGTVVGKYSYKDNEGNPIQVKYYADDASYGVELKSVKVIGSGSENPLLQTLKQSTADHFLQSTEEGLGLAADFYNPTNIKYKTSDPFEILNKENKIFSNQVEKDKHNPDYEIYFQNELKAPKKCGKDKVRVYFDKEKRKIREAPDSLDETARFCSQF